MRILYISLLALLFIACKKNKTTEVPGFQWPEGTGEYAPYTTGSTFTYEVATTLPAGIDSFTYTVTKDTIVDGVKCRKLESNKPALAATTYVHYANGIRTEYALNTTFQGINVPIAKQEVLKEATTVNGTWSNILNVSVPAIPPTIPIPLSIPVTFAYTMQQKDFTKNILSKDYTNTYDIKLVASLPANIIPFLPAGTPSSTTVVNFYSKGVGLSQREATTGVTKIKRYNVVK